MKKITWCSTENIEFGFESGWLEEWAYEQLLTSLQNDATVYDIQIKEDENAEWQRL